MAGNSTCTALAAALIATTLFATPAMAQSATQAASQNSVQKPAPPPAPPPAPAPVQMPAQPAAPDANQWLAELDRLSDATESETGAMALAGEQAARGAYLEALATLERLLATNPEAYAARLDHALYLCAVDDRQGGRIEISRLRPRDLADRRRDGRAIIEEALARCDAATQQPLAPPPPALPPVQGGKD